MTKRGAKELERTTVALTILLLLGLAVGCSPKDAPPANDNSSTPETGFRAVVDTSNLVTARLVTDVESFEAGTPFRLGVVFRIAPKTHVYYRYPGSSGLPTKIEWALPDGFEVGPLQFPNPERFEDVDLGDVSYGYEDEALLFAKVTPPDAAPGSTVTFETHAIWLACMEDGLCIPGNAELAMSLVAGEGAASADAELFAAHAARVAKPISSAPLAVQRSGETIAVQATDSWRLVADGAQFVPDAGDAWKVLDADAINLVFEALDDSTSAALDVGVMTLEMTNEDTVETKTHYLRVGPQTRAVDVR